MFTYKDIQNNRRKIVLHLRRGKGKVQNNISFGLLLIMYKGKISLLI